MAAQRRRRAAVTRRRPTATKSPPKKAEVPPVTKISINAIMLSEIGGDLEGLMYKVSDTEFCVRASCGDSYTFTFDRMRQALDLIDKGPLGPTDDELEMLTRLRSY